MKSFILDQKITNDLIDIFYGVKIKNSLSMYVGKGRNVDKMSTEAKKIMSFFFRLDDDNLLKQKLTIPVLIDKMLSNHGFIQKDDSVLLTTEEKDILNNIDNIKSFIPLYFNKPFGVLEVYNFIKTFDLSPQIELQLRVLLEKHYNFDFNILYLQETNSFLNEMTVNFSKSFQKDDQIFKKLFSQLCTVNNNKEKTVNNVFTLYKLLKKHDKKHDEYDTQLNSFLLSLPSLKATQIKKLKSLISTFNVNIEDYEGIKKYVSENNQIIVRENKYFIFNLPNSILTTGKGKENNLNFLNENLDLNIQPFINKKFFISKIQNDKDITYIKNIRDLTLNKKYEHDEVESLCKEVIKHNFNIEKNDFNSFFNGYEINLQSGLLNIKNTTLLLSLPIVLEYIKTDMKLTCLTDSLLKDNRSSHNLIIMKDDNFNEKKLNTLLKLLNTIVDLKPLKKETIINIIESFIIKETVEVDLNIKNGQKSKMKL